MSYRLKARMFVLAAEIEPKLWGSPTQHYTTATEQWRLDSAGLISWSPGTIFGCHQQLTDGTRSPELSRGKVTKYISASKSTVIAGALVADYVWFLAATDGVTTGANQTRCANTEVIQLHSILPLPYCKQTFFQQGRRESDKLYLDLTSIQFSQYWSWKIIIYITEILKLSFISLSAFSEFFEFQ